MISEVLIFLALLSEEQSRFVQAGWYFSVFEPCRLQPERRSCGAGRARAMNRQRLQSSAIAHYYQSAFKKIATKEINLFINFCFYHLNGDRYYCANAFNQEKLSYQKLIKKMAFFIEEFRKNKK